MNFLKQILKLILVALATIISTVVIMVGGMFGITKFMAYRNTMYAEHFNQGTFDSIFVGISMDDVQKILGQPLSISKNDAGFEYHWYSKPKKSSDYYIKLIIYQNNRVIDMQEKYYVD